MTIFQLVLIWFWAGGVVTVLAHILRKLDQIVKLTHDPRNSN